MPYAREDRATQRGHFGKRRRRRIRAFGNSKPNVRRNRNQVAKLSGAVMRLQRGLANRYSYSQYRFANNLSLSQFYKVVQITRPSYYTPVFGAPAAFNDKRAFYSKAVYLDMLIRSADEPSPIDMTIFLVSPKSGACNQLMADASEDLSGMNNPIAGIPTTQNHYSNQDGKVYMNPQVFNIHYVRRVMIGQEIVAGSDTMVTNMSDARKRLYIKIPWNKRVIKGLAPAAFTSLNFIDVQDDCKLWMVVFNNNSSADGQSPQMEFNCMWNCKA